MSSKNIKKEPNHKDLPKNWQVFHSKKNNKLFYYNTITKKTQWEHPLTEEKSNKHGGKTKPKRSKNAAKRENNAKRPRGNRRNDNQGGAVSQISIPSISIKSEESLGRQKPLKFTKPVQSTKTCSNANGQLSGTPKKLSGSVQSLPPITKPKSVCSLSEGSVSDSSDRILAWLEGTSRVNFEGHPVPNKNKGLNAVTSTAKANETPNSNFKSAKKAKFKEQKKEAILEKVKTTTTLTSEKQRNNILDKLLPQPVPHNKGHGKSRYAPYKSSEAISKNRKKLRNEPLLNQQTFVAKKTIKEKPNRQFQTTRQNSSSEGVFQIRKSDFGRARDGQNYVFSRRQDVAAQPRMAGSKSRQNSTEVNNALNDNGLHYEAALPMDQEEGITGGVAAIPIFESEVADMEIDNAEEFQKEIIQQLKQMRNNLVVNPINVAQDRGGLNLANNGYEGTLYIVLDTNVLLSHLKFVVELKDFPIQGIGRPILVIPWVVIQELDSLKANKWKRHQSSEADLKKVEERVDMLARIAIRFLNGCFQKSDPRVRGQTIDEAAEQVGNLKEESNDDRILQCCLLFKERAQSGNCILFSNDKNLCNKALVNGIKAFNHQRLMPGLRDLFQCGTIVKQAYFDEYKTQLGIQEELAWRREKADEIVCELQIILREGLSYIIETEMKEAYDDIWLSIVHIKPPWTLIDVLQLLENCLCKNTTNKSRTGVNKKAKKRHEKVNRHWIAVFGHIVKRTHKTLVEELRKKFDDRKGTPSSLVFSAEVLQSSLKLFQAFATRSNYDDAIPKCLAAVNVLVQKCQQYQADILAKSSPNMATQPKCLTNGPGIDRASVGNASSGTAEEHDRVVRGDYVQPHEEVMNTFNLIWTAVTQFSTQIFTALSFPNSIPDELAQDLPKASKEEAVQFLGVLCPRLITLVNAIQNVLRDPWEKASQNDSLFVQLEQAIAVFMKEVMSRDNCATPEKLFGFCQDASMRTSLVQGLSQLDRASAMLQHCAQCVALPGDLR